MQKKLFAIRAYCTDCNKMLLESVPLTKKELLASWDKAVLDAPGIECPNCNHYVPNFNLDLRILRKDKEHPPKDFIPKTKFDLNEDFIKTISSKLK